MFRTIKITILFILFNTIVFNSFSQEFNSLFYDSSIIDSTKSNSLYLNIKNNNFFKNNEYFNNYSEGYTLLGFHIDPTITYYPNKSIKISGGMHFLKYSGRNNFQDIIPTFSFQYKISNNIDIVLGTIYSSLNHKLISPLYKFDNFIENNIENGLQFLLDFRYLKSDIWLNWDKFILKNDPFQEELTTGFVSELNIISESNLNISIPIQGTIRHQGGQVNNANENIKTLYNSAYGIDIDYSFDNKLLKRIAVNSYYLIYNDLSPTPSQIYKDGYAIYNTVLFDIGCPKLTIAYWAANEYISPLGNSIFQSISDYKFYIEEADRQLLTLDLSYQDEIFDDINLGIRIQTYYDLISTKLDYSYGLYLTFKKEFFLRKL
ncbi:MAG: hypothetical protein PF487_05125 [Bacteroidales bacterium]|jgi:hypothetical protein|nr:hypothetical protein [Bacteroidales bacterium]